MADVQIVKYKAGKQTFEVLTKPGTVLKFRKGLIGSIDNVLMTDDVRARAVFRYTAYSIHSSIIYANAKNSDLLRSS